MDLVVEEMGFIFCGQRPLLMRRTQVSDLWPSSICGLLIKDITVYSFVFIF